MREILIIAVVALIALAIGYLWGREKARRHEIPQAVQRSRATLGGQFSEQVAPLLQNFPKDLKASEARFVGKPIDFLFFKGMDEQNITDVVFVEVKTGKSSLSTSERKLRDAIKEKRVEWREYRVPEEVTKRPDIVASFTQEAEIEATAK
jgi:predicted Holliday junction resolvase-like endonuclease